MSDSLPFLATVPSTAERIVDYPPLHPLPGDPWVVSSTLQKAIRRGEVEIAERAALSVLKFRGNGLFRRLIVIAFEDIGLGEPELLASITQLCTDAKLRRELGNAEFVGRMITRSLANAPKDRSADYLICSAAHRADWECHREAAGRMNVTDRMATAADHDALISARIVCAWFASGIENGSERRLGRGDLPALMGSFVEKGLAQHMADAIEVAVRVTREPIVLALPILLNELGRAGVRPVVRRVALPHPVYAMGIPLYALDKHTRLGRQAIAVFARENADARESLERHVPAFRHREASMISAFYTDAVPIAHRLCWERADEMEKLGIETDFGWAGVPTEGIADVLTAFRSNLDHLNQVRSRLLEQVGGGRS